MRRGEYFPRELQHLRADLPDGERCWAQVVRRDRPPRQCRGFARYLLDGAHLCGYHALIRLRAVSEKG